MLQPAIHSVAAACRPAVAAAAPNGVLEPALASAARTKSRAPSGSQRR